MEQICACTVENRHDLSMGVEASTDINAANAGQDD
jgi:hypothetical protein